MSAFQKTGLSPLLKIRLDPMMLSWHHAVHVSGAALSDKVTTVSFIKDGVACTGGEEACWFWCCCNDNIRRYAVTYENVNSVPLHECGCMCRTS